MDLTLQRSGDVAADEQLLAALASGATVRGMSLEEYWELVLCPLAKRAVMAQVLRDQGLLQRLTEGAGG